MSEFFALLWTFTRLSFYSVGGGLSSLAEMQNQVVNVHHWITAREFVDGFAIAQLTPGPGMLVTVFIGYRVMGIGGALAATAGMFVPTSLLTLAMTHSWQKLSKKAWARSAEAALAPLAIGLVGSGVYTVGKTAITGSGTILIAAVAVVVLWYKKLPPAAVILLAGFAGWLTLG